MPIAPAMTTGRPLTGIARSKRAKLQELKSQIHAKLIDRLDLTSMAEMDKETLRREIRTLVVDLCNKADALLNLNERDRLVNEVLDETFGLGPLEVLLGDPTITDILINGPKQIYVERRGKMEMTEVSFKDDAHLLQVIDRIVSKVGRRVDETSPMVDARLPDGSRVNAIIPPLAIDGAAVSIRRFGTDPLRFNDLLKFNSLSEDHITFLRACVIAKMNILIVGGTGSGKTTLLNNLSSFIPEGERIITIEDAAELILQQPHVIRLETRPPNIEGKGRVSQRDLVINSLRMRPDRIIMGEVRGAEALDMLQAMNTGHEGSMTTIHANSTRDALSRVETMVTMTGFDIPVRSVRQQFSSAIDLIVQEMRLIGGPRRVTSITEVTGMEGDAVTMQDIFTYKQEGVNSDGEAYGTFIGTGIRPGFLERIEAAGIQLRSDLFERRVIMSDYE